MIGQNPQQAVPQAQPAQPAPQQGAPASPQGAGGNPDPTGFIREVYELLLVRIEAAGQTNPNFGQAIDTGISPQAAQEMFQILPDIKVIFDAIESAGGGASPQPIQGGAAQATPQTQSDNPILNDNAGMGVSRGLMG